MKNLLLLFSASLISAPAFASQSVIEASICPQSSELVHVCKSTPKKGDHELAAGLFEAMTVCQAGREATLALKAKGKVVTGTVDEVQSMVGGVSYKVKTETFNFTFNIPVGIRSKKSKAKLLVESTQMTDLPAMTSTYSCVRQ